MPDSGIRAVLRARHVPLVLISSQVGRLPLASAPLALLIYTRQARSLALAGIVVAGYTAGMAAGAPFLARMVDRWRQAPVLWGSAVCAALGFAVVASGGHQVAVTVLGAAVAGLGTPPLEACLRALWPALVRADLVPVAYTLDIAVQEIIFVVGPLLTLAAVALAGPVAGLVAAAVFPIGGVAAFSAVPAVRDWRGQPGRRHWAGPLRVPRFAVMLVGLACVGAAVGSLPVAFTGYAEAAGNRSLTGWLLAAQAGGALAGGLLYTRAGQGSPRRLPLLAVGFAVGYAPLPLIPGPGSMAVLAMISGLALPPVLTVSFLAADRLAPAGTVVEAFAWIMTAFTAGSALGAALTGTLAGMNMRYGFAVAPAIGLISVLCMAVAAGARELTETPR
jgi:MFS family permease